MAWALAAMLFPVAQFAGAVNLESLENVRILPRAAVAATHRILQEHQPFDVCRPKPRCAKVR
jgi:hypothetical protein